MGECEDSDGPVGSIASRTGFKEAIDGRFGVLGGVNWSVWYSRETAEGGLEKRGTAVEVSGAGRGAVASEVSKSCITLAVGRSAEGTRLQGPSMVA